MRMYPTVNGRLALLFLSAGLAQPSAAQEFSPDLKIIDQPGQTLLVESGPAQAVVFFEEKGEVFDLTLVMSGGDDDEVLRARVGLVDGQKHAMILRSTDRRDRFTFQRSGSRIYVTGTELGGRHAGL
ncbi:hypothetical protein KHP62_11840 [Rhodobacteraceae bacterium NNCM2]|nr:hypothetical protein [Coraliihabitans acroporae]